MSLLFCRLSKRVSSWLSSMDRYFLSYVAVFFRVLSRFSGRTSYKWPRSIYIGLADTILIAFHRAQIRHLLHLRFSAKTRAPSSDCFKPMTKPTGRHRMTQKEPGRWNTAWKSEITTAIAKISRDCVRDSCPAYWRITIGISGPQGTVSRAVGRDTRQPATQDSSCDPQLKQPASPDKSPVDILYYHTDHLGTPRELTDKDAASSKSRRTRHGVTRSRSSGLDDRPPISKAMVQILSSPTWAPRWSTTPTRCRTSPPMCPTWRGFHRR
uniref:Aba392 n=1 Tax=Pasteurella multocida TaxID=747 RepID=B5AN49_PASMD|nr:Aba392 [Pasteurella multocida]